MVQFLMLAFMAMASHQASVAIDGVRGYRVGFRPAATYQEDTGLQAGYIWIGQPRSSPPMSPDQKARYAAIIARNTKTLPDGTEEMLITGADLLEMQNILAEGKPTRPAIFYDLSPRKPGDAVHQSVVKPPK